MGIKSALRPDCEAQYKLEEEHAEEQKSAQPNEVEPDEDAPAEVPLIRAQPAGHAFGDHAPHGSMPEDLGEADELALGDLENYDSKLHVLSGNWLAGSMLALSMAALSLVVGFYKMGSHRLGTDAETQFLQTFE